MDRDPLLRFLSLITSAGALAALILASGAAAQSVPMSGQFQQQVSTGASATNLPTAQTNSNTNAFNWAGYVATGGTYTSVSGSWIVPTVTDASANNVADATWVGIGGVLSTDLIQAGTEAIPSTRGGLVYQAWMETLPNNSEVIPISISPGDAIAVSITEVATGTWQVSFDDATTGKTYETDVQYDSSLSSADWIEEMPVEIGGVIGLDDFGTVNFTSGYTIKSGQPVTIGSSGATPLSMDNAQGAAVATPSVLGQGGLSFTVSRTDAASTPLALTRNGTLAIPNIGSYTYSSSTASGGTYTIRTHRGRYRIVFEF